MLTMKKLKKKKISNQAFRLRKKLLKAESWVVFSDSKSNHL